MDHPPRGRAAPRRRAEARESITSVVDEAAGWSLPRPIRDAMRAWQFETAGGLLDEAAAVLEQRDAIARVARRPPT